jgi:hypothetical protein
MGRSLQINVEPKNPDRWPDRPPKLEGTLWTY